jgi:TonB family protein
MSKRYPYFLLSILLHLLLLGGATITLLHPLPLYKPEPKPEWLVPSYVYRNNSDPKQATQPTPEKPKQTSPAGIEKPTPIKSAAAASDLSQPIPIPTGEKPSKNPVHLIGDKKVNNQLLKLLGAALSAHLQYPKIAIDFRIKGRALVGMVLHPDGTITDAALVESSTVQVLDQAALKAVIATPVVKNIGPYLTAPKYIVVGVIFR